MSKEDPTKDFLRLVRDRSKHTNRSVEEAWDKDNLIKPTVGSANTCPIIDPSPYLRSFQIPRDHRSHLFVPVSHIKAMRIMLRLWGTYCELSSNQTESEDELDIEDHWDATTVTTEYAAHSFLRRKGTELNLAGYCILDGMADPLSMPDAILDNPQAVGVAVPHSFLTMPVHEFFDRIHKTFPGERMIRDENERGDWNPIVNTALPDVDRNKRDMGFARYSSTVGLLMDTMETGTKNVPLAERRAHLDVWVGMAMSSLNIDGWGNSPVFIPRTGGRFLITGKHCERQTGHNDFPVRNPEDSPGYFTIVTGAESATLWVAPSSHTFVFYSEASRQLLSRSLLMTEVTIPQFSIFVGHGHLQHAGAAWTGAHSIRYHMYFSPVDHDLPDAILFAYGESFGVSDSGELGDQTRSTAEISGRPRSAGKRSGATPRSTRSGVSSVKSVVVQSHNEDSSSSSGGSGDEDGNDDMDFEIADIEDK